MAASPITEIIFVGLPGLTHHYGGLSGDNVASSINRGSVSSPRQAALQVLELVRLLKGLGLEVGLLPPQLRPHMPILRPHFSGDDDSIIRQAGKSGRALLERASSAAAMWTANAATVAPVPDSADHKLHLSVANLFTNQHRRIEAEDTYRILQAIFAQAPDCEIHRPLSAAAGLKDEGAANHMRLSPTHSGKGLHVFVYGTDDNPRDPDTARQSLSASKAVAAQHHLPESQLVFVKQSPHVIREGVFHNDVIAVSNGPVLLAHEDAYTQGRFDIGRIADAYEKLHPGQHLIPITITDDELSVFEAVHTYFFNSQIVTLPDGGMAVIAPGEAKSEYDGKAAALFERIRADSGNPINEVHYADLRQSMRNGGGPACLRLRVPVTPPQLAAVRGHARVLADDVLVEALSQLVVKHYPDSLGPEELDNPELFRASKAMLADLSGVMRLPLLEEPA